MQPMQPCRDLVLEICRVPSRWHYQVFYVFTGTRVYYEIWGKQLSDYYGAMARIETAETPLQAIEQMHQGRGYRIP